MAMKKRRDLTDAERQVLARLEALPAGWTQDGVLRFSTDDGEMAATYADMMEKRRELSPRADTPPTLGELFGLASAYLERSGRTATFAHTGLSVTETAATERCFAAEGSPLRLLLTDTDKGHAERTVGDRLILLRAENDTAMLGFDEHPAVRRAVKWETAVGANGILPTVLPCIDGVCYDLRRLSDLSAPTPLDRLFLPIEGARLLLIEPDAEGELTALAAERGVRLTVIAALTDGDETCFLYGERDLLRIETAKLRAMPKRETLSISAKGCDLPTGRPIRSVVSGGHSPYLAPNGGATERLTSDGVTVSAAVRQIGSGAFRAAVETILAPLLSVAGSGADYIGIRLGIGLRLPAVRNDETNAQLLSVILGIYRVQTEFACPAALYAETDEMLTCPELTVYALSDAADTVTAGFAGAGSGIFCVSPVYLPSGLPDLSLLRRLLREIRAQRTAGRLTSACVAVSETLGEVVARTEQATTCRLTDGNGERLSVAFVLGGIGLPYHRIGTVALRAAAPAVQSVPSLPPPVGKYVWHDRYEITVLSHHGDAAAVSLAASLRAAGADCVGLWDDAPVGALSRRVLTSRILILCPNATLPEDAPLHFALRLLSSDGGLILRLGERAPMVAEFPSVTLQNGISEDFLHQIGSFSR